jgi:hypothetical protein
MDILHNVASHDGQWYWYQLDRCLFGRHPEVPSGLMATVNELATAGLIEIRPNPPLGDIPRYWLTEAGRVRLMEQ